jgi:hypothetical protein
MSNNTTEKTIDDIVHALTAVAAVAPSIIAIVNTVKANGSITLAELQALQATRHDAVAEADKALGG